MSFTPRRIQKAASAAAATQKVTHNSLNSNCPYNPGHAVRWQLDTECHPVAYLPRQARYGNDALLRGWAIAWWAKRTALGGICSKTSPKHMVGLAPCYRTLTSYALRAHWVCKCAVWLSPRVLNPRAHSCPSNTTWLCSCMALLPQLQSCTPAPHINSAGSTAAAQVPHPAQKQLQTRQSPALGQAHANP